MDQIFLGNGDAPHRSEFNGGSVEYGIFV